MTCLRFLLSAQIIAFGLFLGTLRGDDGATKPVGLPDRGALTAIELSTGRTVDGMIQLAGKDSGSQLVVSGQFASGQVHDITRNVQFSSNPAGIVEIDEGGFVKPLAEGETIVSVSGSEGLSASIKVRVTNLVQDLPINFGNQIVPVFTKHGCNGGGCHGKSGGQNGFRLSLLGFEPTEDYEFLVREGRGRRIFPAAPERSLLLTKGIGEVPHGGGQRMEADSPAYRLIVRWIEQGMPYGNSTDPHVVGIEVFPKERIMTQESAQQLVVVAKYSDGSLEDVTRMVTFESNDKEMAEVNVKGLVSTGKLTGSVAVMCRYQGHVDVFRSTIPLGLPVDNLPAEKNFIDAAVFKKLKQLGLPPSQLCDDATFIRRVTVDLCGRLPTVEETQVFLNDGGADKRDRLVKTLVDSDDYAAYFANKWAAILRNKRASDQDKVATYAFHDWIKQSFYENKPYDQFVREIITASGEVGVNPPAGWYREVRDLSAQVEDTAQLFLGLRIQCARCHHHPFETWSQQDYYGFAAFYSQVGRKPGKDGRERIFQRHVVAQTPNPKTGQQVLATGLGSGPAKITKDDDARHALADWMSKPENPFFAKALVNRYWKHFFSRGLVDPEDDMRVTNPASNPELLDALADDFKSSNFDLKRLVTNICTSQTYQLSAIPNEWNQTDKQSFSRYYPKRLNAEVLLDAVNQVTGTSTAFGGMPGDTRAVQLPDNGFNTYFLTVFGRPESSSACECERSGDANLAQSLHLLNSSEIQGKLTDGNARAAKLAALGKEGHADRIQQLYLVAFSRMPDAEEMNIALQHIAKHEADPKRAYEDIIWALLNTKEFMFNH